MTGARPDVVVRMTAEDLDVLCEVLESVEDLGEREYQVVTYLKYLRCLTRTSC